MIRILTLMMFVIAFGSAFAREILVPSQPVSPCADTEVSTNVVINKADISYYDLKLRFDGTPTNNLKLAFGTDVNTKGVLDVEEVETRFGWRSGRYFIENVRTWEMCNSEPMSGTQSLSVEMHLDVRYNQQQMRRISIAGVNETAFSGIVSDRPPTWMWRREWNLM